MSSGVAHVKPMLNTPRQDNRRSRNACNRCKLKKLRCRYDLGDGIQQKCAPCRKAATDCEHDILTDGIPRSTTYVAELEQKITALQSELHELKRQQGHLNDQGDSRQTIENPELPQNRQSAPTIFNLFRGCLTKPDHDLPDVPSEPMSEQLIETTYLYTQARYWIVDWIKVREWHHRRDELLPLAMNGHGEARIAAYFLWMIYAIGSRLLLHAERTYKGYYTRAIGHLDDATELQDLTAVQALLALVQYNCRVPGGPSHWALVGATVRLCIELGYHRHTPPEVAVQRDPRTIELEKRVFWTAYCFDRMVSQVSRRPFAVHDLDLDVELPVDIDVGCIDSENIRDLQLQQEAGGTGIRLGVVTSSTAALNHVRMYRLRSRIIQRFTGPYALPPTYDDINTFLTELDSWREQSAHKSSPQSLPQQDEHRVQTMYLQTVLLLFRPVLSQPVPDSLLTNYCAKLAAAACENAKVLSISPKLHSSPIIALNCFYCGVTLLQCLTIDKSCLTLKRALRALGACSSALAVHSKLVPVAATLLQLFDMLSDRLQGSDDLDGDENGLQPTLELRQVLDRIIAGDVADITDIASSLQQGMATAATNTPGHEITIEENWMQLLERTSQPMESGGFFGWEDFVQPVGLE